MRPQRSAQYIPMPWREMVSVVARRQGSSFQCDTHTVETAKPHSERKLDEARATLLSLRKAFPIWVGRRLAIVQCASLGVQWQTAGLPIKSRLVFSASGPVYLFSLFLCHSLAAAASTCTVRGGSSSIYSVYSTSCHPCIRTHAAAMSAWAPPRLVTANARVSNGYGYVESVIFTCNYTIMLSGALL